MVFFVVRAQERHAAAFRTKDTAVEAQRRDHTTLFAAQTREWGPIVLEERGSRAPGRMRQRERPGQYGVINLKGFAPARVTAKRASLRL